jgi:hypothetical protein
VSAATGRIAAIFVVGGVVEVTKMSRIGSNSPARARSVVQKWIADFSPDILICEDVATCRNKGNHTKGILQAIADTFSAAKGNDFTLPRIQRYANKYEEAAHLAKRYKEIAHLLPKRPPIWKPEPRLMSFFEALALFETFKS